MDTQPCLLTLQVVYIGNRVPQPSSSSVVSWVPQSWLAIQICAHNTQRVDVLTCPVARPSSGGHVQHWYSTPATSRPDIALQGPPGSSAERTVAVGKKLYHLTIDDPSSNADTPLTARTWSAHSSACGRTFKMAAVVISGPSDDGVRCPRCPHADIVQLERDSHWSVRPLIARMTAHDSCPAAIVELRSSTGLPLAG